MLSLQFSNKHSSTYLSHLYLSHLHEYFLKVFTFKQVNDDNANENAPRLTSIPPHVVLINKLHDLNGHVSQCSNEVVREVKQELEDRFVGGDRFQANVMLNQVQQIQAEMQTMLADMRNGGVNKNVNKNQDPSVEVGEGVNRRRMYYWGGRFHSVPKGFEVPRKTLTNFITCWYCGDERESVLPL